MRIKCEKDNLLKAIQAVQNAVSVKSTLPILSHILLEAKKSELKLIATDLELAVSVKIDADIQEEGVITVPARKFSEIIKELPSSTPIEITLKKSNTIQIESHKSHFKLMGLSKDDFPQIPEFPANPKPSESAKVAQSLLKKMIQQTSFAMSHDEARYVLNGVLISFKDKMIRVVATDGRRLAMIEEQAPEFGSIRKDVIIPVKTVHELSRNLGDSGEVIFVFKENQVHINIGSITITSRLIEGEYPNYEQVIPKKVKEQIKVGTQNFLQATRRASILTNQESQSIKLNFIKDRIIITKNTPELGEVREELEVDYKGPEVIIGFNPVFLIDVFKNIDSENIEFGIIDPEKPAVIRSGENYTYIVLPMQVA